MSARLLCAVALLVPVGTAPASPAPLPSLAREDTIALANGVLPEVVVTAPRVTLDEILHRVALGEARRDSMIRDQAFTATVRVVKGSAGAKPELLSEAVTRVYKKKPDLVREIPLRRWTAGKHNDDAVNLEFRPSTAERVMSYAFSPELRDQFRFRILGRDVVGGHVIYRVGFEPRSPLNPFAPHGAVWIDTNEFVILRQESTFDRSPVPLLLKSIDRFVVERARTSDGLWAIGRMLLRARFTISVPHLGSSFDMAVLLTDYKTNAGLDDAFFAQPGGRRVSGHPGDE